MAYYDALTAKWPSVTGSTTADKIVALNAETVAGPDRPVPITEVMYYLRTNGLWLPIKAAASAGTSPGAQAAVDYNDDIRNSTLDVTLAAVQAMLADLVSKSLLTQGQSDAIVALKATTQPWWQANGYRSQISMGDIVMAGLDTSTGYSAQIGAPASNQFNVSISVTVTGPKSTETVSTFANTLDADYSKYFAAVAIQNMMTRDASLATF